MRWLLRSMHAVLLGLSVVVLGWINLALYTRVPAASEDQAIVAEVEPQLAFLRTALARGAGEDMQALFPEGHLFTHVMYGLAWVELGLRVGPEHALRTRAAREARWALAQLSTPAAQAPFPASLPPDHGMFYTAWTTWLLAGIVRLQPEGSPGHVPGELVAFRQRCAAIAHALDTAQTPFLAAYPGQAWPVDSFPALAALRVHGQLVDDRHEATLARWLRALETRLDPMRGLVPHQTDPVDGTLIAGTRATSQTVLLRLLAEIEPALGQAHYRRFRSAFFATRLGLPGFLEYPAGIAGAGDVDSGPLILGVSISASAVGLGTSRVYGDHEVAAALWQTGEALALPITWDGQRRYALGLLPVGDAFAAWSKAARPVAAGAGFDSVVPWWWRLPSHALSLAWLVVLAGLGWLLWRRRRARTEPAP